MRGKILFIGHEASRTGAPIVLLNLLKWLKKNSDIEFETLISHNYGHRGELISEFNKIAKTTLLSLDYENKTEKIIRFLLNSNKFDRIKKDVSLYVKKKNFSLIYSNTVGNGHLLKHLFQLNIPIILHLHELELIYNLYPDVYKNSVSNCSEIIAASNAVKLFLEATFRQSLPEINVVHEFIEYQNITNTQIEEKRRKVREELGIKKNEILVCGSGTVDLRKGADLFVQVAYKVIQKKEHIKFLWLGQFTDPWLKEVVKYDLLKLGVSEKVCFIGGRENSLDYFAASDIFLMTSREDTFPLVNIENALIGNPIICFDKSGGSIELVGDEGGIVVPYLNIDRMSSAIIELAENAEMRKRMGDFLKKKSLQNYLTEVQAPKIFAIIKKYL
jgi:glycosyltransferase involved in cell wall biosynthesis